MAVTDSFIMHHLSGCSCVIIYGEERERLTSGIDEVVTTEYLFIEFSSFYTRVGRFGQTHGATAETEALHTNTILLSVPKLD